MRNIEKSLTSYVKGNGPKVNKEVLLSFAHKNSNDLINILFNVINKELDSVNGSFSLDRVRSLLEDIHLILETEESVNRKIVTRRLHKLDEKLDRIQVERKQYFTDPKKTIKELEKIRTDVEKTEIQSQEKETKQYDFISYLVDTIRNITYIEYTFNKMPSIVNSKDREDKSLFENCLTHYLQSIKEEKKEDILYYGNLLSLIISQKNFNIKDSEKRKIIDNLNSLINHMSISKHQRKGKQEQLQKIKDIIELLKTKDEKKTKIEELTKKYNISLEFPKEIIEQVQLLKLPNHNRYQVDEYIVTIDGEGAIEIDDALSCKILPNGNYLLGVHVASVLGYFPYNSPIIEEAISRTSSIYLPIKYQEKENEFNKVISMFPYEFAANKGSLLENSERLTRSYFFEITSDGTIVNEKFLNTVIKSNKKATYREIDKVLMHGSKDIKLQETIENLAKVAEILDKRYKVNELYEQLKENREDYSDLKVKKVGAEKIVYQAMLLTGNRVADFFASNKYPCLYRVHHVNSKDSKNLEAMVNNLTKTYGGEQYKKLYQLINGLYPKGWYASSGEHNGLGLDHYCHCTSALRRSADIIVEHGLEICHDKIPTDKELILLEEEIEKRASEINSKQDPIEWFLRDYNRAYQKRR